MDTSSIATNAHTSMMKNMTNEPDPEHTIFLRYYGLPNCTSVIGVTTECGPFPVRIIACKRSFL